MASLTVTVWMDDSFSHQFSHLVTPCVQIKCCVSSMIAEQQQQAQEAFGSKTKCFYRDVPKILAVQREASETLKQ